MNVELAHKRWRHLRGDEWRALEWMSLRSWDEGKQRHGQPAREFWAGYRNLAYGLGLIDEGDTEQYTRSIKERVRRAVDKLAERNAITVLDVGKGRDTTRIRLHLDLASVTHLRPSTEALGSSASEALDPDTGGEAYGLSAVEALRSSAGRHSD